MLSLWLPAFAIERCRPRSRPKAAPAPQALLVQDGPRILLDAVADEAAALGLSPGMPLADARALCPDLRAASRDLAAEAVELGRLADWAGRYTPWTAVDSWRELGGAAGLWLDVSGCAHLFGGEVELCADLTRRLARLGFTGRAGLAPTPGAAWALARYGQTRYGQTRHDKTSGEAWRIAGPEELREALAPLPLAGLRLPPAQVELLARFGLERIGDLLGLPAAALSSRVGPRARERLAQALGERAESLSPRRPCPRRLSRRNFGEPIAAQEDIARALEGLIAGLCEGLGRDALGARRVELALYRVDGGHERLTLGISRPSREPAHLKRLFAERLERIDPGFGIDAMVLAATVTEPLSTLQLSLASGAAPPPLGQTPASGLAALVDRLSARLGPGAVTRQDLRASHLPEVAVVSVSPFTPLSDPMAPVKPSRPLRLFAHPEPVEATAALPDHPPLQFRWRRVLHRVARAEGPERIAAEWWGPDAAPANAPPRDYFRVEDEDGRRFWLYRCDGGWFLQGLFG